MGYAEIKGTCGTTAGAKDLCDPGVADAKSCGTDNKQSCCLKANCAGTVVAKFWTNTAATCQKCAAGKTRAAGDKLDLDASTECADIVDAGTHGAYGTPCDVDHHVKEGVCTPCPAGTYRAKGDDPKKVLNTVCEKKIQAPLTHAATSKESCAVNEHVQNHACVKCEVTYGNIGWENDAGDDPHHHDTTCHKKLCAENERVVGHKCVSCTDPSVAGEHIANGGAAGHLTNTAGDDATGPDTKCYEH